MEAVTSGSRPGEGWGLFLDVIFQWQATQRRQPAAEGTVNSPKEALTGTELLD